MSERLCEKCGYETSSSGCTPTWCVMSRRKREPQEGAPTAEAAGNRLPSPDEPRAGVPSCDSELEAIRARVVCEAPPEDFEADAGTLLRMVDELTKERDDLSRRVHELGEELDAQNSSELMTSWREMQKERDDLRAKLAETQEASSRWAEEYNRVCGVWANEKRELEAKLAEAEKERDAWKARAQGDMKAAAAHAERAEAAEARVRELERIVTEMNRLALDRENAKDANAIIGGLAKDGLLR